MREDRTEDAGSPSRVSASSPPVPIVARGAAARHVVLAVLGLSGLASLALEVVWFRILVLFIPATTYAFTTMLAAVLGGIAGGSWLAARLLRRDRDWLGLLTCVQGQRVSSSCSRSRCWDGPTAAAGARADRFRPASSPSCRRQCSWAWPSRSRCACGPGSAARRTGSTIAVWRAISARRTRSTSAGRSSAHCWEVSSCCRAWAAAPAWSSAQRCI